MLNITKQSDYGLLLITHLKDKKGYVPLSNLLTTIAATLTRKKILESREGKVGGYRLSSKAKTFSLYDYLKIFEGDLAITGCMKPGYDCPWDDHCQHKAVLKHSLANILGRELKKYKLLRVV